MWRAGSGCISRRGGRGNNCIGEHFTLPVGGSGQDHARLSPVSMYWAGETDLFQGEGNER